MKFDITVAGGAGETQIEVRAWIVAFGILSPDGTPFYNFEVYDEDLHLVVLVPQIAAPAARIEVPTGMARLEGLCKFVINAAADNGIYGVKLHLRKPIKDKAVS